jgi:hypothetical protein
MGLVKKMFSGHTQVQEAFSSAEAFAAITLAAIASDGYLSQEETTGITATLSRMKLFRSYPHDVMNRLFDKLLGILQRDGINSLFDTAKESLPPDLREAAFAVTADLILASGIVTEEENSFLDDLYHALGISTDIAMQIVQVMMIKNRG